MNIPIGDEACREMIVNAQESVRQALYGIDVCTELLDFALTEQECEGGRPGHLNNRALGGLIAAAQICARSALNELDRIDIIEGERQ